MSRFRSSKRRRTMTKIAAAEGLRLPRPYRRLVPAYPETAARAEAEATVDVLVDLDRGWRSDAS